MEFISQSEFWVAVSFFIFMGVLVYLGVHRKVTSALDARALRISKELDERAGSGKRRKSCSTTIGASWAMLSRRWTTSWRSPPCKLRPLLGRHASH